MVKSKMTVEAKTGELDGVVAFVTGCLEDTDCPIQTMLKLECVIEEIFVNICYYAYPPDTGPVVITVEYSGDEGYLTVEFSDRGKPYDPLAKEDPDVTMTAKDEKLGGLGIYLTKKLMDEVTYRYENGANILTMKKGIKE